MSVVRWWIYEVLVRNRMKIILDYPWLIQNGILVVDVCVCESMEKMKRGVVLGVLRVMICG